MASFGNTGWVEQPGATYKVAQDGFATYDVAYEGLIANGFPWTQGDVSFDFPNVVLLSFEIVKSTGKQCGHSRIVLHYEGRDNLITTPEASQNIAIDITTSQEPIESHIDFTTVIGGTPSVPLNDAIFDTTTGEFLGFAATSQFAGVRSYLLPQEIYTTSTVATDYPSDSDLEGVGHIIYPTIPLPVVPSGRNWLGTGIRVQNIANVYYRTQETGMLSGPRGWNEDIYGL